MLNYLPVEHFNENVFRAYTVHNHKTIKNVSVTLFNGRLTDNDTVVASKLKNTHTVRIEGLNGLFVETTKQELLDVIIEILKTRSEPLKTKRTFDVFISLSPEVNVTEDHAVHELDADVGITLHNCTFIIKYTGKHRSRKEMLMMQLAQIATEAERKRMELIREYVETFDVTGECPPVLSSNGTSLVSCFTKAYNRFFCKHDFINLFSQDMYRLIDNERTVKKHHLFLTDILTETGRMILITPMVVSGNTHKPVYDNGLMSIVSEFIDQMETFENRQPITLLVDDRLHLVGNNCELVENFTVTENGLLTTAEGRSCLLISSAESIAEGEVVDTYTFDNVWKLTKRTLPCVKAIRSYFDESTLNRVEYELDCVKASLDGLTVSQVKSILLDAARRIESDKPQHITTITLLTKGAKLKSSQLSESDHALLNQSNLTVLSEINLEGRMFRFMFDNLNMEKHEMEELTRRDVVRDFFSTRANEARGWFD